MADIKRILGAINQLDTFQRVDSMHPLDLYIGIDETARWTLLLISDFQPLPVASSKMILVKTGKRSDKRWTLSFSLVDDVYQDMFVLFCEDIIISSGHIPGKDKAIRFVCNRYKEWKEMLANTRGGLLTPAEIKGLLGEMYFLKEYLSQWYGIRDAALSWTGPKKLPQDFIIQNTWYEVKTISPGKTEVTISSVEQLDCSEPGELVILRADKTSVTNSNAINLNKIYHALLDAIPDDEAKESFSMMLLRFGYYPRPEYEDEEYTFSVNGISRYTVDAAFPCLRRSELPQSVGKAEYTLSIAAIGTYRKE